MTTSSLTCTLTDTPIQQLLSKAGTLAVIAHDSTEIPATNDHIVTTGMPQLATQQLYEVWSTDSFVEQITVNNIRLTLTPDILIASCITEETGQLAEDIRKTYEKLLQIIVDKGYPHLLRAWNYIADINQGDGDDERYKQFCSGRYTAFSNKGINESDYPAASALGHNAKTIVIYLISARKPGIHIENPNQLSAYTYPKMYGPKSPSFARATACHHLGITFISGTASITGHKTRHSDNVEGQLKLTLENIESLVDHIEKQLGISLESRLFKIYIRNRQDFPLIKNQLSTRYPNLDCLYLQADICRADLLLEIEAIYCHL